jgi:translation initiation factor 2 subunit 2
VFGILKAHNPELTGERRRTTLKPPQVAREGTKKTVFTNFMELCKSMNRNHEHVLVGGAARGQAGRRPRPLWPPQRC